MTAIFDVPAEHYKTAVARQISSVSVVIVMSSLKKHASSCCLRSHIQGDSKRRDSPSCHWVLLIPGNEAIMVFYQVRVKEKHCHFVLNILHSLWRHQVLRLKLGYGQWNRYWKPKKRKDRNHINFWNKFPSKKSFRTGMQSLQRWTDATGSADIIYLMTYITNFAAHA